MSARIDVWSDYVCPFCYLEEPILARLTQEFGDRLVVQWRAFELRPEPVPTLDPNGEYLRDIWRRAVYPMAAARGMILHLPPVQPRSRLAFQAAEFARAQGKFTAMNHALFRAFFAEGRNIGKLDVLLEIGRDLGLETDAMRDALETKRHLECVLSDERLATQLEITGVPAMLIRRGNESIESAVQISGARPYENIRASLERCYLTTHAS